MSRTMPPTMRRRRSPHAIHKHPCERLDECRDFLWHGQHTTRPPPATTSDRRGMDCRGKAENRQRNSQPRCDANHAHDHCDQCGPQEHRADAECPLQVGRIWRGRNVRIDRWRSLAWNTNRIAQLPSAEPTVFRLVRKRAPQSGQTGGREIDSLVSIFTAAVSLPACDIRFLGLPNR